jgi:hypothetical protein
MGNALPPDEGPILSIIEFVAVNNKPAYQLGAKLLALHPQYEVLLPIPPKSPPGVILAPEKGRKTWLFSLCIMLIPILPFDTIWLVPSSLVAR